MSGIRRSGRPPKPKRIEHTLAVTPRGRGRPRGSSNKKSTPGRTPKVTFKKPWEDDEFVQEHLEEVYDEDEEESDIEEEKLLDFDDVDEELDLDSVPQNCSYEELPEGSMCPWLEMAPADIPLLELPSSSTDLVLPHSLLMQTLEVYELCRSFYRSLFLSPFLLEDFCAALVTPDNSPLLSDLHICLFKMCLRDDDEEQVNYTVMDTHNSFNILIQLLEPMTYGEIIRQYAEAHRGLIPPEALDALNDDNYPFVGPEARLHVLHWMCDKFLASQEFKKIVRNDGKLITEDKCRDCNKAGDLLPCDSCEAAYHLKCLDMRDVPDGPWNCAVCEVHNIRGVADCLPIGQNSLRQPLRMTPIGRDRHGRTYLFAARRIFIHDESGDEVVYYSTAPQLHELVTRLDDEKLELALCKELKGNLSTMIDQMSLTLEITNERRDADTAKNGVHTPNPYLNLDNLNRMPEIVLACSLRGVKKEEEMEIDDESDNPDDSLSIRVERMMGIRGGFLMNSFWTGGLEHGAVLEYKGDKEWTCDLNDPKSAFRMGRDDLGYKAYINHFNTCDFAKPSAMRVRERDRKKYMCGRLSLDGDGHFEWSLAKGKDLFGSQAMSARYIEWMINKMYKRIPTELMHRRWSAYEEKFNELVKTGRSVSILKEAILLLECGMRKTLFLPQWWSSLGSTYFRRMSLEWREERSKEDKAKKKMERELVIADAEDDSIIWVKYTKSGGPPKHNIWRMKDEQYRVNGRDALGGWYWLSVTAKKEKKMPPMKWIKGKKNKDHEEWEKRSGRLETLIGKWNEKKEEEKRKMENEKRIDGPDRCFAPYCNGMNYKGCYSVLCRLRARKDAEKEGEMKKKELEEKKKAELGGEIAYPMPQPISFRGSNGKTSILVIKERYLRRVARSGGLNPNIFLPGFSATAKANPSAWNYPCMRPLFDHCWRYNTMEARSMQSLALQLRVLWSGVRWADMNPSDKDEKHMIIHHPDRDEIRVVIGHREMPLDGTYERYEVSLTSRFLDGDYDVFTEEDEGEEEEMISRNQRGDASGRKRKAAIKAASKTRGKSAVQKTNTWVDGVDLKLFEIREYWKKWNEKRNAPPPRVVNGVKTPMQESPAGRPLRASSFNMQGKYASMHEGPAIQSEDSTMGSPMAKRTKYDLNSRYDDKYITRVYPSDVNVRRTGQGKEFPVGFIRGGGGGGPMQGGNGVPMGSMGQPPRRVVMVNAGGPDGGRRAAMVARMASPMDEPPVIPRYDSPSAAANRVVQPVMQPQRVHAGTGGKVIMIRRPDGSTQLLRPVGGGMEGEGEPRMMTSMGMRGGRGGMMMGARGGMVRMPAGGGRSMGIRPAEDPFMKRMAIEKNGGQRMIIQQDGYDGMHGYGTPRPGQRMNAAPMQYAKPGMGGGRFVPRPQQLYADRGVISRDMRFGMSSHLRRMNPVDKRAMDGRWNGRPGRSIRFEFEQNEEEDRAIAEAIAREEEIMRMEDEMKRGHSGMHSEVSSPIWNDDTFTSTSSNLVILPSDDGDTKMIKNMLETMIQQVCKWDKVHGWSRGTQKNLMKKRIEVDPTVSWMRRSMSKQQENALGERMENLRKEINKRRVNLEMEAELAVGVNAPWKKSRGRPHKVSRRHSPLSSHLGRSLDPSQISLGSPSQLLPSSPKKRRDSERTQSVKEELGWNSIADRVRRNKRTSESEESSQRRERRVKLEIPEDHVPSPSSQEMDDRCICGKAFNPKKLYLRCIQCNLHRHLKCLQISEKKARKVAPTWTCENCRVKEEELYCLCRKPYDDSQFYVGCDSCEGWYHPSCVQITQQEAETVAEYICPLCLKKGEEADDESNQEEEEEERAHHSRHVRTTSMSTTFSGSLHIPRTVNLGRSDFPILRALIESIWTQKLSEPFRYPVDPSVYPDYAKIIRHPMDLSEMQRRVDQLEYHRIEDLANDFALMIDNARKYNAEGSPIHKNSFVLEAVFSSRLIEAKRAMNAKRQKMRKQSECGTVDSCLDIDTDQLLDTFVDPSLFESLL
ncbi:hypothetical protein PFISCL1PPCAC_5668 [Pristionchus fissidentatus]|uniref:Uncharacterized protein n=1 Tax=Pristionchus fissidentatus TaxID=1538716 RepID=A0AAV5V455_9BILA|nr:hypothetical protein PFISCL1PPCAC_5668 [Pristionchus fissidentatus]